MRKILTDEILYKIYLDTSLGIKEILKIITKEYGIKSSANTLVNYLKKMGLSTRKELGIKKVKFGHNDRS